MRAISGRWAAPLRALARSVFVMVAVVALLPVWAAPAAAHGRGVDATNFSSRVTAEPDIPGASWRVYGGDELLELTSDLHEVVVLGYSGEPYLRVGPDGVWENRNSPATYLNQDRYRVQLPGDVDAEPGATPDWRQRSAGSSYAWHDHRVHLMTTALPAEVTADPSRERLIQEWSVPVVVDGREAALDGELRWVPGPSPWPWLLAGVAAGLPALLGLTRRDPRGLVRPAAVVLGVVVLANATRVVDDVAAMPLPATTQALSALQTLLFLVIGGLGAWKAWRGADGASTALAVGSAAILVGQGLLYVSVLSASQLTSVLPDAASRFIVAASIGQAATVGAVAFVGNRRMMPQPDAAERTPVGA